MTADGPDGGGPSLVDVPATAGTPEAVVRFLVGWLVAAGRLPADELEPAVRQIMRREELGSTGVGRGLAIPHAASPAIDKPAAVVGRLAEPLDWAAGDGERVGLVALVIGPGSGAPATLRALEEAVRRLRGDSNEA
jgi:PTS system fructose-specific IIA component/PTS system nitrogen regulatory IIA component